MRFGIFYEHQLPRPWEADDEHKLLKDALEQVTGRFPDKAYVYLLRPNIAIAVDLHPLFLHGAEQTVRAFREAQSSLSFPLNEGEHCRRCQFFLGLCPAGKSRMADVIHPSAIHGQHLSGDEAGLGSG